MMDNLIFFFHPCHVAIFLLSVLTVMALCEKSESRSAIYLGLLYLMACVSIGLSISDLKGNILHIGIGSVEASRDALRGLGWRMSYCGLSFFGLLTVKAIISRGSVQVFSCLLFLSSLLLLFLIGISVFV